MSLIIIMLCVLAVGILLLAGIVILVFLGLRRTWRRTRSNQFVLRGLIIAFGLGLMAAPYIAFKISDQNSVLARVPDPLEVAAVEYRLEESWGIGMPGDNETGFVVYRLTDDSANWVRQQGNRLGDKLQDAKGTWRPTPVDDRSDRAAVDRWHNYDNDPQMMSVVRPERHPPTVSEYLEKYGFTIAIEEVREDEANRVIQSSGSFYSYGEGGSVTLVDPVQGKVYFFYAG